LKLFLRKLIARLRCFSEVVMIILPRPGRPQYIEATLTNNAKLKAAFMGRTKIDVLGMIQNEFLNLLITNFFYSIEFFFDVFFFELFLRPHS
jgi:hypothetical protein